MKEKPNRDLMTDLADRLNELHIPQQEATEHLVLELLKGGTMVVRDVGNELELSVYPARKE